jgi:uncharacterized protein DUF1064
MKPRMTIEEIKDKLAAGTIRGFKINNVKPIPIIEQPKQKKKSKYGNNKVVVDEIEFDSEKEAKRYGQLKLMMKAGEIGLLQLQVSFELNKGGTHSLEYIADFVYIISKTGEKVVEDAKGFCTKEYKKKRRLMLKVHGIKIKEV